MNAPRDLVKLLDDQEYGNYNLKQCFFGEHLLPKDHSVLIGITESEKTAVMASIMMPDLVWLAAGNIHGLDEDKCRALKNRTVLLFPDVGAYNLWTEYARTLNLKIPTATDEERANGADMADSWVKKCKGSHNKPMNQ